MYNVEQLIEQSIDVDDFSDEYYDLLDKLAVDRELTNKFIESFKEKLPTFNKYNIGKVLMLLNSLIISREVQLNELYPMILDLMYKDFSYDVSWGYRFVRLLIKIKGNKEPVFDDILNRTDMNNKVSVGISVCSLYEFCDGLTNIPVEKVSKFLDIVYECSVKNKDDKMLKLVIEDFLLPIINNNRYAKYYHKFKVMGIGS
jgi:hypothetical protein